MGAGRCAGGEGFRVGSSQPKPWAGRRKHIADGPEGAASRGASKAKVDPPRVCALPLVVSWEGHRLAWPKLQPRSGVSGEHGRLGRACAKRGLFITEVAGAGAFHGRDDRAPLWSAG
jgi:hypothetical protein